jgi:hypothetical protein
MARRRFTSGARRGRDHHADSVEHAHCVSVPEGLHEAIEIERHNLSKAESVLGCLAISMEYDTDSINKPYYPDVAQLARELVRQSINGLDSLALQLRLLRNKVKESSGLPCVEGAYSVVGRVPPQVPALMRSANVCYLWRNKNRPYRYTGSIHRRTIAKPARSKTASSSSGSNFHITSASINSAVPNDTVKSREASVTV